MIDFPGLTVVIDFPGLTVVIDFSGLKVFGADEWPHEKHGGQPCRSWRRLHLAVDPDSGDVLAAELTTKNGGDISVHQGAGMVHSHARPPPPRRW